MTVVGTDRRCVEHVADIHKFSHITEPGVQLETKQFVSISFVRTSYGGCSDAAAAGGTATLNITIIST